VLYIGGGGMSEAGKAWLEYASCCFSIFFSLFCCWRLSESNALFIDFDDATPNYGKYFFL